MAQTEQNHSEQNNLGRQRSRYLANLIFISFIALTAAACALFFLLRSGCRQQCSWLCRLPM